MTGLVIIGADPSLVEVALDIEIDMPAVAFVGIDSDQFAGAGGLAWGKGRCWLWFRTTLQKREYAVPVIKQARMLLRKAMQLGETEVFTVRDPAFETSPRLLAIVGFKWFAIEDDRQIYRWTA